ncbi:MAG: erythromycin esterase family protein [Polyangiaceae bacterium]
MTNRIWWRFPVRCCFLSIVAASLLDCASAPPSNAPSPVAGNTVATPSASVRVAPPVEPQGLSGHVKLANGTPAAGAVVALVRDFQLEYPGASPRVPMVLSDANGRYAFSATEIGRFGVTATLGRKAAGVYGGVRDLAASRPETLDLELGDDGFTLTGKVENADGAPVSAARIEAVRLTENEGEVYLTTTDSRGRYELRLTATAPYFVVVDAGPLPRTSRRIDPTSQSVDFRLDRAAAPRPTDAEIKAYLAEKAFPLATLQAGQATADLAPLKKMIGDAHIVGIGEATHGAAEFRLLWHRLIEFLVTELGFTTVAFEAGWSDALALDDYVTTGRGDPKKGLADLYYWNANTEEVLELLRWMRRYNQDPKHPKKLHFLGYDAQFSSHAVPAVIAYLDKVDAPLAARAREFLAPLREDTAENTYSALPPTEHAKTLDGIRDLLARFDGERAKWVARTSESAWSTAREHVQMIRRSESIFRDESKRDFVMAETAESIFAKQPKGTKTVLIGHNFHMSAKAVHTTEMGQLLRERHGNDYFVIGTTFSSGSLLAYGKKKPGAPPGPRPIETFTLGAPPAAGVENALALAEKSPVLVDLRGATGPFGDWLGSKLSMRWVGGIFRGEAGSDTAMFPRRSYDALIYVDKITPFHLNPGAK